MQNTSSNRIYTNKQEAAMRQATADPEAYRGTGGLNSAIGGGDAVRATEIHAVICEFDHELQALRSIAQTLYDRLEPVMHAASTCEQDKDFAGSSVPLVNRVRDFRQVVRSTSSLLRDALERIEL